jgi:hypothetical protein
VLLLDTEDLLLHLALHLAYHHHFERAALKGLVDVTMVLDHADPPVDWRRLASRADAWGAADFTRATLRVARDVLGARVDDDALAALGASDEDEAVAGVATRYILTPAVELPVAIDEMGRSAGLTGRLGHLLRAVFLSPAQMRELYGLRPGSPLAWLYYPVRVIDLLARRGSLAMRLMLRTASVEPTLDRAQDGRTLERWAEAAAAAQTNARAPREESTS